MFLFLHSQTKKTCCSFWAQRPTFCYQNYKCGCFVQDMITVFLLFVFPRCLCPVWSASHVFFFRMIAEKWARWCCLDLCFISACNPEAITAFQGGFLAVMGGGSKIIFIMHARSHTHIHTRMRAYTSPYAWVVTVDYMLTLWGQWFPA